MFTVQFGFDFAKQINSDIVILFSMNNINAALTLN